MQDYEVQDKFGTKLIITSNQRPTNQQMKTAFKKYYDSQASSEIPPLEGISEAQLRSRPREQESFGDMAKGFG